MPRRLCPLSLCGAVLFLAGCGPSPVPVTGVVKLDGTPVEGATVTFATEDGKQVYTGFTDAGGNFSLSQGEKPGAAAGNYKVTVTKSPKVAGAENMSAGSADYMKMMQKEAKANAKPGAILSAPGAKAPASAAPKTELPAVYASMASTTLTAKVPSDGPIVLELNGGKEKK